MRILQVSSSRTYGGGERHVVDLCRGLKESGHEVFAAIRPTSIWRERLGFLPPENVLTVSIRNSFGVLSAIKIAEFARDNEIDIIHAHIARDYIPASIACLRSKRTKFVLTRHVLSPLKPFNKFALTNLERAIGVSEAVAVDLRKIFSRKKVTVILNGLDITPYSDAEASQLKAAFCREHEIPDGSLVIGSLGELKESKGQRDLVLAVPEILRRIPNAFFVVTGEDHSTGASFRRELRRLVSVFNAEDRFLWLNWQEDARAFFAATDLFVSPSHTESFGLAILEAMAHGKPVIATATEGARLLVNDDDLLCRVNDPVDLAKKIANALSDPQKLNSIGQKACERAAAEFSLKRMIDRTEELYKEVLDI